MGETTAIPMFPLGTVLLPGTFMPLQVFEPRYRALLADCLAGTPELGVVLIERGPEVGGGDSRFGVGCRARIVEANESPDGRWAVAIVGGQRIRVEQWLPDDPYPRAEVSDWPDVLDDADADAGDAWAGLRRVLALASEVGERVAPAAAVEADDDPVVASYQLAALVPVGPLDRLALLSAPTVGARLDLARSLLVDLETVLATRLDGG